MVAFDLFAVSNGAMEIFFGFVHCICAWFVVISVEQFTWMDWEFLISILFGSNIKLNRTYRCNSKLRDRVVGMSCQFSWILPALDASVPERNWQNNRTILNPNLITCEWLTVSCRFPSNSPYYPDWVRRLFAMIATIRSICLHRVQSDPNIRWKWNEMKIVIVDSQTHLHKIEILMVVGDTKLMGNDVFAVIEILTSIRHVNEPIQIWCDYEFIRRQFIFRWKVE